jgi:hypothetical protein
MRLETTPPSSMLTTLVTPTRQVEWGRPRRQTDPNVVRRPSDIRRQAARCSVDCSSWLAAAQTKDSTSTTPLSPCSPLSIRGLSNPALAEIPLRRFNALRSSTGSSESCPSVPASTFSTPTASVAAGPNLQTALHSRDYSNNHNDNQSSETPIVEIAGSSTIVNTGRLSDHSFKPQPSSAGSEPRSPHPKRPPASRSSHGIETATGPPPALSTQRTLLQDKTFRTLGGRSSSPPRPFSQQSPPASPKAKSRSSPSIDAILKSDKSNNTATEQRDQSPSVSQQGPIVDMNRKMSLSSTCAESYVSDDDRDRATIAMGRKKLDENAKASSANGNRSRNEDIFLNIAKSNANSQESSAKAERRRVSLEIPTCNGWLFYPPSGRYGIPTSVTCT